jgi:hypothetical protein
MWKTIGAIVVVGALVQSVNAQQVQQVNPYFGKCRTAVMNNPAMLDSRTRSCGSVCGAAIRQCIANKGKI